MAEGEKKETSHLPATALTMSGRTSMVAGVVSYCLAPWLETQIPEKEEIKKKEKKK